MTVKPIKSYWVRLNLELCHVLHTSARCTRVVYVSSFDYFCKSTDSFSYFLTVLPLTSLFEGFILLLSVSGQQFGSEQSSQALIYDFLSFWRLIGQGASPLLTVNTERAQLCSGWTASHSFCRQTGKNNQVVLKTLHSLQFVIYIRTF